jgi:drug/metabolite transporter (DMT)-like permease
VSSRTDVRGDVALAVTVVTWASAFPAIRVGLDGYGPWALGLLRLLVASACLVPVAAVVRLRPLARRHWPRVLAAGLLGQTLYQGLLMTGERTVPAGTASLLIATAPVFSVLGAAVLLRERVGRRWLGMAVAFSGAALVAVSLGVGGGAAALVVLAAALCQGAFHVVVKPLAVALGAVAATAWTTWAGMVLLLPALPALVAQAPTAPAGSTWSAVYLGVVPSALGFLAWTFAVARTSIARSTVSLYLVPVVAVGLSWWWLGERPTALAVTGGALAVLGVVLVRSVRVRPGPDLAWHGHDAAGQQSTVQPWSPTLRWSARTAAPGERMTPARHASR